MHEVNRHISISKIISVQDKFHHNKNTKKTCHPESVENRTKIRYFQTVQDLTGLQMKHQIGKMLKHA